MKLLSKCFSCNGTGVGARNEDCSICVKLGYIFANDEDVEEAKLVCKVLQAQNAELADE
jgi:hypothetical protein